MSAGDAIRQGLDQNPEIRMVLEIAARARELESREPPRELQSASEAVAMPTNSQCAVQSSCVLNY